MTEHGIAFALWEALGYDMHRTIKKAVDPDIRFLLRWGVWERVRPFDAGDVRNGVSREIESDD